MGWIILGIIGIIIMLIIINSNTIILNKNFNTFYEKGFKGTVAAIAEFANNYLARQNIRGAEPD